jgi:cytochrome c-type biogenesis protein
LPLVPPYLCLMTGTSIAARGHTEPGSAGLESRKALLPAIVFVLGFSVVFVALGAGASAIGALLRQYLEPLGVVAGVLIIAMGLNFLGVFRIVTFSREARFRLGGAGLFGSFLMGLAFAFGWTPCIGPVLGAILGLAGSQASAGKGALLLAVYSAGLGMPFILAAAFVGPFLRFLAKFRAHLETVEKAMGVLLVATGILFMTGGLQRMAYFLLETFPTLGNLG